MSDEPDCVVPFEEPPPLTNAPAWGNELARRLHEMERRQQQDRQHANGELRNLSGLFDVMDRKLGQEPDSDGRGGKGLIGDVRKVTRDLDGLIDLRNKGVGFVLAVGLFGAIIIAGLIHLVQGVVGHAR